MKGKNIILVLLIMIAVLSFAIYADSTGFFIAKDEFRGENEEKVIETPVLAPERAISSEQTSGESGEEITEEPAVNENIVSEELIGDAIGVFEHTISSSGFVSSFNRVLSNESTAFVQFEDGSFIEFGIESINREVLQQAVSKQTGTKIVYENVLPGMSVEYESTFDSLKETIVLNSRPELSEDFTISEIISVSGVNRVSLYDDALVTRETGMFSVSSDNTFDKVESNGNFKVSSDETPSSISLSAVGASVDSVETTSDIDFNTETQTSFYIPAGTAYDSDGAETPVTYKLFKEEGLLKLEVSVDDGWLMDEARIYPVYIDPSITKFYITESEGDFVNVKQAGNQINAMSAFYNTAGDFAVAWRNNSGTTSSDNSMRARYYSSFSQEASTTEFDYAQCYYEPMPKPVSTDTHIYSFAGSAVGGELIGVWSNGSAGSEDVFINWERPAGDFDATCSRRINCATEGGGPTLLNTVYTLCESCTNQQSDIFAAASVDGNRYGACWISNHAGSSSYQVIFRLWDGTAEGMCHANNIITPTSANGCSGCGAHESRANTNTDVYIKECAMDFQPNATNDFVVCYSNTSSKLCGISNFYGEYIFCSTFNSTGNRTVSAFTVTDCPGGSSTPYLNATLSDVTFIDNDTFVVAYKRKTSIISTVYNPYFSIFKKDGTKINMSQAYPACTGLVPCDSDAPSVAALENGNFVFVFAFENATLATGYNVYAIIFNSTGAQVGAPFIVNDNMEGDQRRPHVESMPGTNDVVITWDSPDSDSTGIKMTLLHGNDTDYCGDLIQPNSVYSMTSDVTLNSPSRDSCFNIEVDDVIFDCNNHRIDANGRSAVQIKNADNVTLRNCILSEGNPNIKLYNSTNINFSNVNVSDNSNYFTTAASSASEVNLTLKNSNISFVYSGDFLVRNYTRSYTDNYIVRGATLDVQKPIGVNKTYGYSTSNETVNSVIQTKDGGFAAAGYTDSNSDDMMIYKFDEYGNTEWGNVIGNSDKQYATSIIQNKAGDYVVVGVNSEFGGVNGRWVYILANGTVYYNRTIGALSDFVYLYDVEELFDGGYIIAARNVTGGMMLIRTHTDGTTSGGFGHPGWNKTYGGTAAFSVKQTTDGGFISAGITVNDVQVVKTDQYGNVVWNRTYTDAYNTAAYDIIQDSENNFVFVGTYINPVDNQILLVKLYPNGTKMWTSYLGGANDDGGSALTETSDKGYAIASISSMSSGTGMIYKANSTGSYVWSNEYGGSGKESFFSIAETYDAGFVIAGTTSSYGSGQNDSWIVKTNSTGGYVSSYGGWMLLNMTYSNPSDESNLWLYKYNSSGFFNSSVFASSSGKNEAQNFVWANITSFGSMFSPMELNTDITSCRNLTQANTVYTVTQSLSGNQSNGICIDVQANNITLDCSENSITGSDITNTFAVYVGAHNNTTIKNCNILDYDYGIALNATAPLLSNSPVVFNNTISSSNYGVYADFQSHGNISFNHILYCNNGISTSSVGFVITKNNVSFGQTGIDAGQSTISDNWIAYNTNTGIYSGISGGSGYSIINNNTIVYNSVGITDEADYHNYTNNNISCNLKGMGSTMPAMPPAPNYWINNTMMNNTVWDISTLNLNDNNIFQNLTLNDTSVSFVYTGSVNIKYADGTGSPDISGYSNISHYLNITNSSAAWISVNVSYSDSDISSAIIDHSTIRIWKNSSGTWLGGTNVGPTAQAGINESEGYVYANISNFGSIFAPMGETNEVTACKDLTIPNMEYVLTSDLTGNQSDGICIDIRADNITLDCDGHNITSDTTNTTGIKINGYNNATITNCVLNDYRFGLMSAYSSNSNFDFVNFSNSNMIMAGDSENCTGTNILVNDTPVNFTYDGEFIISPASDPGDYGSYSNSVDGGFVNVNTIGTWENYFSTSVPEDTTYPYALDKTVDGGYIYLPRVEGENVTLIKADVYGKTEWTQKWKYDWLMWGMDVQQTSDRGYIIVGRITAGTFDPNYIFLLKTDESGVLEWYNTYNLTTSSNEFGYVVKQTSDDGYIVAGTDSLGLGHVLVMKTFENGSLEWNDTYTSGMGYDVEQTSDGGYIIAGHDYSNCTLLKLSSAGVKEWNDTYGSTNSEYCFSVEITSDNGYMAAGYDDDANRGYMFKTNSTGYLNWSSTYLISSHTNTFFEDLVKTRDGNYATVGYGLRSSYYDVVVMKVNEMGTQQTSSYFRRTNADSFGLTLEETRDGGYTVGWVADAGGSSSYVYLNKLDYKGQRTYSLTNSTYGQWFLLNMSYNESYITNDEDNIGLSRYSSYDGWQMPSVFSSAYSLDKDSNVSSANITQTGAGISSLVFTYTSLESYDPCDLYGTYTLTSNLDCLSGMTIHSTGKLNTDGYNVTVSSGTDIYGQINATGTSALDFSDSPTVVYDGGSLGSEDWSGDMYVNFLTIEYGAGLNATSGVIYVSNYIDFNGDFNYNGGSIDFDGTNTKFDKAYNLTLSVVSSPPADVGMLKNIGYYVEIENTTTGGGFGGGYFNITYDDLDATNESNLSMWRYNGTDWTQNGISSTGVNNTTNNVWADISMFSVFAPMETNYVCMNITTDDTVYNLGGNLTGVQLPWDRCVYINATNVTFDCQGHSITGSSASDVYGIYAEGQDIIIRNCTVSGYDPLQYGVFGYGGIYLYNTSNATVENCNSSNNGNTGITVSGYSNDSKILNNTLDSNYHGLRVGEIPTVGYGFDVTARYNNITQNTGEAVFIAYLSNIIFESNNVSDNNVRALRFDNVNDSLIDDNYISDNNDYSIYLEQGVNNNITRNVILNYDAVTLSNCNNTLVANNSINNSAVWNGVDSVNSNFTKIAYNNISYAYHNGISISGDTHDTVENNEITYCGAMGIGMGSYSEPEVRDIQVRYNNISFNGWDFNRHGIRMMNTFEAVIENNTIHNSTRDGINVDFTNDSVIRYNNITENGRYGIYFYSEPVTADTPAYNNNVTNNIIRNNTDGIFFNVSSNNNIVLNDVYFNSRYGIHVMDSNYTDILNNTATQNDEAGIVLNTAQSVYNLNVTVKYNNISFNGR